MKWREIIDNITFWIIVVILIVVIYFLILKLLGKSSTALQIIYSLVIGLVFYTANLGNKVGRIEGASSRFEINVRESFSRVREDISEMKKDIKQDIKKINKKLK